MKKNNNSRKSQWNVRVQPALKKNGAKCAVKLKRSESNLGEEIFQAVFDEKISLEDAMKTIKFYKELIPALSDNILFDTKYEGLIKKH